MARKWIQKAITHPGALTARAKAAGMSLAAYEAHPPKGISSVPTMENRCGRSYSTCVQTTQLKCPPPPLTNSVYIPADS